MPLPWYGPAPRSLSVETLAGAGYKEIPHYGVAPPTVPGAPAAWGELVRRFGRLPLTESMRPAIEYAEQGFPVSPVVGDLWRAAFNTYREFHSEAFRHWFETFAPQGRAPVAGEMWRLPEQAATLTAIAETNAEVFYRGDLAEKTAFFFRSHGGYLTAEDLSAFNPDWVEPVSIDYRGYRIWEIPPNGHGIVALMALNILKGYEFHGKDSVETCHRQIEAVKLAFADGLEHIADIGRMRVDVADLLSGGYAADRRCLIGHRAVTPLPGKSPSRGDTVYLASADGEGNMVSYIQSNYEGFGSGMVVPGSGIAMHNRGVCFSSDPKHVNFPEPGKRPYHTIIPGFLTKDGEPIGPFGVMGGFMQPQGHVMVVMNSIDFGLNPQAALDAPRFRWRGGKTVDIEAAFPEHLAEALVRRGHDVKRGEVGDRDFGRGQIIWRTGSGVLAGGSEPRADGQIAAC